MADTDAGNGHEGVARAGGLLVLAAFAPKKRGSLEDQLAAVTRALGRLGVPVTLVFPRPAPPSLAALLVGAGATLGSLEPARPGVAVPALLALIRRHRPALVHAHFLRPLSPLSMAARAAGLTVVHSEHMALRGEANLPSLSASARRLAKHMVVGGTRRGVVRLPVSRFVAATITDAEGTPPGELRVLYNGVDVERFAMPRRPLASTGAPAIACVSRMAPGKGVEVAIEALARSRSASRPELLVVGDGPDLGSCRALAERLGLRGRVRFLGLRDDVERVLAACRLAWVPSCGPEAFGLAAAEAMAAGLPVVASRVGGLVEVVEHGTTGLLVAPGDPAALAAATDALLDDEQGSRRMGRAGRARAAERFSMDGYVAGLLSIYREVAPRLFAVVAPAVDARAPADGTELASTGPE